MHIAVEDVKIKTPGHADNTRVAHAPISIAALDTCVTKLLVENVPLPDFQDGYDAWKAAQGGVFSIPVAEIVGVIEQALNQ